MPNPWTQFAKTGGAVLSLLALLGLIPYVQHGVAQGWPGGFFSYTWAILASWFGGLHWYLPAAALAGGVALRVASHSRRQPRLREVILVATIVGSMSFALRGFIGPQLEHHAFEGLLDLGNPQHAEVAAVLQPNDWNFLRELIAEEGVERGDVAHLVALLHSTVAFAILSALMLPLGVAIGRGSSRFSWSSRRRAAWGMAAGTIAVVYGAQIGAWRVAVTAAAWPAALIYVGFLTVPLVILLTLMWSGAPVSVTGGESQRPLPPGAIT